MLLAAEAALTMAEENLPGGDHVTVQTMVDTLQGADCCQSYIQNTVVPCRAQAVYLCDVVIG